MAVVYYNGQQYNVPDEQAYSILKQTNQLKPSRAGMPSNVQAGSATNSNTQKAAQTATANTSNKDMQWSSGDKHYNDAVNAKTTATNTAPAKSSAGMPSNVQAGSVVNTTPNKPTVTNTAPAKTPATNTGATKPATTSTASTASTAITKPATTNTTSKPAVTNNAAASTIATANTAPADNTAGQPVVNDFDLNLYDKYAADRIKKKFNKAGKADQYQSFINDFYGSDTMDANRYDELMNKYELGNTFKNDFDLGKANYMETYDLARRNKVNAENKAKKQEEKAKKQQEKQAKADADEEQRVKAQVVDMLKNATPYERTQFMIGQGPIYETIAKYSKYFG